MAQAVSGILLSGEVTRHHRQRVVPDVHVGVARAELLPAVKTKVR